MPADNFLLVHWQNEVASLKKHFTGFSRENGGVVHKIRVNIKKLRAYLKLYLLITKNKEAREMFRDTEKLFTLMGEHRNLELNKLKAGEIACGNEALSRSWCEWLNTLQAQFNIADALQQYNASGLDQLTSEMQQNLSHLHDDEILQKVSSINEHYIKKARHHMHHFRHNFHEVRKELKIIFYLGKICSTEELVSKQQLELLDGILDDLGHIQDDTVSLMLVEKFRSTADNKHEKEILDNAMVSIHMRMDQTLSKAHHKAENFLKVIYS
jgi:hypothetical protein